MIEIISFHKEIQQFTKLFYSMLKITALKRPQTPHTSKSAPFMCSEQDLSV